MELLTRPKPNKDFYRLSSKDAGIVAMRLARMYGPPGKPDMPLFVEFLKAHTAYYNRHGKQLTI